MLDGYIQTSVIILLLVFCYLLLLKVVWAETVAVGCGVYRCSSLSSTSLTNAAILVCNYGPA